MRWDAFLAPAGCPLPEVVKNESRLTWPDARSILEQLTHELAAACRDRTLPPSPTVDRIWVQANGRVQLLDGSLAEVGTDSDQKAALLLLRQVAELTLEGRLRRADEPPASIRAPVPKHAMPMLNRLLVVDGQAFSSIDKFGEELAATRIQPCEITTAQRTGHLALLTTVLFFPLLLMFVLPCVYLAGVKAFGIFMLEQQNGENQQVLEDFQHRTVHDCVSCLLQPDPEVKAHALIRVRTDIELHKLLAHKVGREVFHETRLRQSAGWISSVVLNAMEKWISPQQEWPKTDGSRDVREDAKRLAHDDDAWQDIVDPVWVVATIFVIHFALAWTIWAFLTRGGLTFRLAGIALLRSNGRKALRIQCAWRALLVWIPVTALLILSVWLDSVWLADWFRQTSEPYAWAYWLSWLCWGLALALLPLYVGLALRLPDRSLHDRLAGTYLMPR